MASLHPSNPYYNAPQSVQRPQQYKNVDLLSGPSDEQFPASPPFHPVRSQSIATSTPISPPSQPSNPPTQQRKTSIDYQAPPKPTAFRTRSIGGPFGTVYFERDIDTSPPNDDEIIIATVRITDGFRRASIEANAELPARPPRRGFMKRVSTRVSSPTDTCRYTALKMPRKDYKRYFARDREGGYAGTDPEREWSEAELRGMFERFQNMALRSIPGGQEFGEGVVREGGEGDEDAGRSDSAVATSPGSHSDFDWATVGTGVDNNSNNNNADRRNQTVVWPGSIWT